MKTLQNQSLDPQQAIQNVALLPDISGAGEARPTVKSLKNSGLLERICLWTEPEVESASTVWDWINSEFTPSATVHKVQKVRGPRSLRSRFDIWVWKADLSWVFGMMRKILPAGWHCKVSERWTVRVKRRGRQGEEPVAKQKRGARNWEDTQCIFSTLNINGVQTKRQELDDFLVSRGIACCCLQETNLPAGAWTLRLRGYTSYHVGADSATTQGARGLATVVHNTIPSCFLREGKFGQSLWVRAFPDWAPKGVILGNLYLGFGRSRRAVLRDVVESFKEYSAKGPVLLMGDFNLPMSAVRAIFLRKGVHFSKPAGELGPTFYRGRTTSWIDHGIYNAAFAELGAVSHQLYKGSYMSDHIPYGIRLRPFTTPPPPKSTELVCKIDSRGWWENAEAIALNNRWEPLMEQFEDEGDSVDKLYDSFVQTSYAVAKDLNKFRQVPLTPVAKRRQRTYHIPRDIRKSWKRVHKLRRKALEQPDAKKRSKMLQRSTAQLRNTRRKLVRVSRLAWADHMYDLSYRLVDGRSKEWWMSLNRMSSDGQRACPVVNDDGELVLEGHAFMDAWREHFGRLLTDDVGSSRDRDLWESFPMDIHPELPGVSGEFTWDELAACIRTTPSGKTPGASGISVDFFKACLRPQEQEGAIYAEGEPPNFMAACLLSLVNSTFKSGKIPDAMREKWLVAIPKKGDLTDRNNYRGIALMDSVLKLIMRMLGFRVSAALEKSGRLIPEQGGFRPRRECIAQVIALYEVIHRVKARGEGAYVIFVDIEKAYDKVLHEALFRKLWCLGIRGKGLEFLRALYSKSRIKVRTAQGLSEEMDQEVGVHQGGPFSPTGFSVYINDVLDRLVDMGYKLNGISRRFIGLLFADDMVLLARSKRRARAILEALEDWGKTWGMTFGVKADGSKCAVMAIGTKASRAKFPRFNLGGKRLPWVREYTYLGIPVSDEMSAESVRLHALKRGRKALARVRHVLMNMAMPIMGRLMIFHNVVVSSAMYGAELWGGEVRCSAGFDSLMRDGIGLCFGLRSAVAAPTRALAKEAQIAPFAARMTCARIRLFEKIRRSNDDCWLKRLMDAPVRSRSWVTRTGALRNRLVKRYGNQIMDANGNIEISKLKNALWSNYDRNSSVAWKRVKTLQGYYPHAPWTPFREWLTLWNTFGGGSTVERQYLRMRAGTFWTAERYAKIGWLPEQFRHSCPLCGATCPEDMDHYLFECSRWSEARKEFLFQVDRLFPGCLTEPDRALRVLGMHPTNLTVVGLAKAEAAATERWEKVQVLRRGWVRARAPIWRFLARTLPFRWGKLSGLLEGVNQQNNSSSQSHHGRTGADSHHEQRYWEPIGLPPLSGGHEP